MYDTLPLMADALKFIFLYWMWALILFSPPILKSLPITYQKAIKKLWDYFLRNTFSFLIAWAFAVVAVAVMEAATYTTELIPKLICLSMALTALGFFSLHVKDIG